MLRQLHVRKDSLKFDVAHMTVSPDGTKERLHGHSYRAGLTVSLNRFDFGSLLNLRDLRNATQTVCDAWNEHFLLPLHCPHLSISSWDDASVDFTLCSDRYVLPTKDVKVLEIENAVIEHLTVSFAIDLWRELGRRDLNRALIASMSVELEESTGQGGCTTMSADELSAIASVPTQKRPRGTLGQR